MRKIWGLGVAVVAVLLLQACGLNMEKHYQKMRSQLMAGDFDDADKYIDSVKEEFYSKDNRLLYYMDKGMVLHLGKKYEASNQFLEKAKQTADELWTESISKNIEAWLTTDNSVPYQGEDFEKVLLHFVGALNYIGLTQYEQARVEARQVTAKLELYNQKYGEQDADEEGKKHVNAYKDDAFARWLSGKLSETDSDASAYNDAWIDYKKALTVYAQDYARYQTPTPRFLIEDAMHCLQHLGGDFAPELAQLKAKYPAIQAEPLPKDVGEIVFIHMAGEAPYKKDEFWTATATNGDVVRVAFPRFVPKAIQVRGVRASVAGQSGTGELAEDITAIALQNLDDHMGRIRGKAIARAVAKYIASKAAQGAGDAVASKGGKKSQAIGGALALAGTAFMVGSAIAEEADKRSWITLPGAVNVVRLAAPAGEQTLDVDFLNGNGSVAVSKQFKVNVVAGKPSFVTFRTFE